MLKPNMLLQSIRNGIKCKVVFVDQKNNMIQIEYLNPLSKQYEGIHTYNLNAFRPEWVEIGFDYPEPKSVDEKTFKEQYLGQCSHEWKNYQGLKDSFEFCIKCDKKRNQL